ncbi:MAG: hypothetical protein WCJ45_02445 [bacterium]
MIEGRDVPAVSVGAVLSIRLPVASDHQVFPAASMRTKPVEPFVVKVYVEDQAG